MASPRPAFLLGLFLTTLTTLALEILDTRLLSVVTWYHLSFFAVSTAMFGMTAGAIRVYLGGAAFAGRAAPRALARHASLYALSIPLAGLTSLYVPIPPGMGAPTAIATLAATLVLATPFYLSGIVVALCLTRIPGPGGLVYGVDLAGAAAGSLALLALFELSSVASGMLLLGALAAVGAAALHAWAGTGRAGRQGLMAAVLLALAAGNDLAGAPLGIRWAKGAPVGRDNVDFESWTLHGLVLTRPVRQTVPFYWGAGRSAGEDLVEQRMLHIDGAAGTAMTGWDGSAEGLRWVRHDVTSLPYHLRRGGHNAVVGVGGGRDVLTALWGGSESVLGIEVNGALVDLLQGELRAFAGIADAPGVALVHDDARSYLTRTDRRFDVLQMSLIDTWAATGAGAFTLSENGLYTVEAWQTFLGTLRPGGLFSVSRWYAEAHASETSRLVSLATATLLARGVERPREHLLLAAAGNVATLLVATEAFAPADLAALDAAAEQYGFAILLAPHRPPADPLLGAIMKRTSVAELSAALSGLPYDYTPPTDERPYFFNVLKPGPLLFERIRASDLGTIAEGNLLATATLGLLWLVSLVLVVAAILGPLALSGRPSMPASAFGVSLAYFALIGAGFMLVQIPLMQRFSVHLGHPTYSVAVVLPAMILAAGLGSVLSDRLDVEAGRAWSALLPLAIAANLLVVTLSLQGFIERTIHLGLVPRAALVGAVVGAATFPLGLCFPLGLRLVRRISDAGTPWMWGINGAAGVLASVSAVAISMWSGISTSLYLAAAAYAVLAVPAWWLTAPDR